ncbi:Inosine-uridine nucleoside N-ribohydrolase [Robiginitalea myxolifaciens]|uniref:Inosine-uridine nucleoside N-ribohydrolase n=1 Tax=Robiginitalea myxolifaciens TaxID=400055 RepID=A0A1I6FTS5_9FLAO|nr:nucleoside hydrolase [Robiginitalea myxolifaciens]SFR33304.1 Inosine-uridine nucleoside N-ribohydrolase [Robiginitalea myxolifaciens]
MKATAKRPIQFIRRVSFLPLLCFASFAFAQRPLIVDADTGNEVDDLFALAHILLSDDLEVTALNAAHWQTSHWAVANSMENSHRLNQQLLGEMGMDVPTLRGAPARMYDWGDRAQHSAAAYEIIRQARQGDSLEIIAMGALTNLASAVFIAPEIAPKLKIYWLGTTMDFETGVMKRNDFNPLMDPFALDYLLESRADLHIIPLNVAVAMEISRERLDQEIGSTELGEYLIARWEQHLDGSREKRILWDLALVAAYAHPERARQVEFTTSRDSGNRVIQVYDWIDAEAIYADFFTAVRAFKKR